ncbi:hypothetical protein [Streptomyces candidus]|uniref:Uncharacterized protein n=1 Tax=Streptomyces candidus TaxID=67283 RepID=A0A7X0HG39_9ACTN|nr:hypothetical protein [Streptomyces candidus]MBB6437042.1 hypothetical protein [Streptomyces candidus]GHH32744.1 hypothetical protein GCM10018773_02260 [Streptomyces candidus]
MRTDDHPRRARRLLPWVGPEGKPCYLLGDSNGSGTGHISRMADDIESVQLTMSAELLDHAADLLADRKATAVQLQFLAACMAQSLRDVRRIAVSRGARIPVPQEDGDDRPELEV